MGRCYVFHARALCLGLAVAASIAGPAQASPAANGTDRDFIHWDSQIERAQQNMGDIAQRRGGSGSLREFGRRLQQEHTAAYSRLREIAETMGEKSDEPLGTIHVQVEHRFEAMPADRFDLQFARHEAKDHQNFLEHFRTEAAKGTNRDLRDYASRQIPILEGHLKEAEALMSGAGPRQ
jgi:putative membrane protein